MLESGKLPAGRGNCILESRQPASAPSSPLCRKSSSVHYQLLLLLNAASDLHQALDQLLLSHKEARSYCMLQTRHEKARFTGLFYGRVIGYSNHLRSYTLNLCKVPECIRVVLFSLRKHCFMSCLPCLLLEAVFVPLLLCGQVAVLLPLKPHLHSHGH